jgi:hypothetical protein
MTTEPWQASGVPQGGFFDEPPDFLPPGHVARWAREEAAARAEEQRLEAERAERAELSLWEARQWCLAKGLEWNPQRPYEHVPSVYQRADMAFAAQDPEARAADIRAAEAAGRLHLLPQGVPSTPGEPSPLEPAEPSGSAARNDRVSLIGAAPDVTTPGGRITAALRRWSARDRRRRMEQQ